MLRGNAGDEEGGAGISFLVITTTISPFLNNK